MLELQFYSRILFVAIFGIAFIYVMSKLAQKNPVENEVKKSKGRIITACILLLLAMLSMAGGITWITMIQFPSEMAEQPISRNMIVRSSYDTLYWGYPTKFQTMAIQEIQWFFLLIGFAAYRLGFKKSNVKWWVKVLKVVYIVLIYAFYVSSTDWHYFDSYELIPSIIYLILLAIPLFFKEKKEPGNDIPGMIKNEDVVIDIATPANLEIDNQSETVISSTDVDL